MSASLSYAQSATNYVSVEKLPSWVIQQNVDLTPFEFGNKNTKIYRLVDWQAQYGKGTRSIYKHFAITLLSSETVQDNSTVEITFDPSYQSVAIHNISILRDGQKLDRLVLNNFKIFSVETDADRLIYNGKLRATLIIPDVRIGDTLNYAYTILGSNPAFGKNFTHYTQLQYSEPIQRMHERVLIDKAIIVKTRAYQNAPKPIVSEQGAYRSYTWEIDDLQKFEADNNQPNWYYGYKAYSFSSYSDWAEVGRYFSKYYAPPRSLPKEVRTEILRIKNNHIDAQQRALAALAYVQKEIRYLGIEIGAGGYIPRTPSVVLKQRFGDCKDMTLLLLSMLKELGVDAVPLLVDTDMRGGIDEVLAGHSAFDHVLVRANIDGKLYYLDGTRGEQLGDINHFEQGWYEKGVVIANDSKGMFSVDIDGPNWWKTVTDSFDLVSDPEKVFFKSETIYYGAQSDSMLSWYKKEGDDGASKSFLKFFQNTFPTIEQSKPFEVKTSKDDAKISFIGHYEIPNAWTDNKEDEIKTFTAYASDLNSDFPEFVGATRTTPYKISHPIRTKQVLSFKLDETWSFEDEESIHKNDAFDFAKVSVFKNSEYTQTYTYTTKSDHIKTDEYVETMAQIKLINDELGVELQFGTGVLDELTDADYESIFMAVLGFAALVALLVVLLTKSGDEELRHKLIFYPVTMKKFLLMSCVSLGIYQYYWIYKNWL